jgi:hypothetical protein
MGLFTKTGAPGPSHGGAYTDFPSAPAEFDMAKSGDALARLFKSAVAHAQDRIDWYDKKAGQQQKKAKSLRFWSIMFFSIGTGAPLVMATFLKLAVTDDAALKKLAAWPIAEVGYLFLAVAGALVLFDQFFQYSVSWMRYRQAQAHLEVLLADLRYDWDRQLAKFGGVISDGAAAEACVKVLGEFVGDIERAAEIETKEWATQFSAGIAAFDKSLNTKRGGGDDQERGNRSGKGDAGNTQPAAAGKPPTGPTTVRIQLAVEGVEQLTELVLKVDTKPIAVPANGRVELQLEAKKLCEIEAEAMRAGSKVKASKKVTPEPANEGTVVLLQLV